MSGRVAVAALLVLWITAAPLVAAGMEDRGGVRGKERASRLRLTAQDDIVLLNYFDGPTGKRLLGFVDPSDGTFSVHGLTITTRAIKGAEPEVVASWAGQEVILPDIATLQATPESILPFQKLVTSWTATVDMRAVEGLQAALRDHVAAAGADSLSKQSCGWDVVKTVGIGLVTWGSCGMANLFGCVGGTILFLAQLHTTADSCGWCGFGRAC